MNKLIIIGMCLWIPIWIFSYTNLANLILNKPENILITITILIIMVIGIILMFVGFIREIFKK